MSQPVLGIDLGTTNSVVAIADGQRVRVLLDEQGNRLIPSVVSFHPQGDVLVGYPARERRLIDAENTIYSVKRLIGRPWGSEEVRKAQERFAFRLASGPNGGVLVEARGESFTLPEISAFVLREVRRVAEAATNEPCTRAVVTVPANFNELQRAATKAAGKVAGLDVLRILNEPTAAALAYGYGKGGHERIAIFDLGGGTFDVTILDLAGDLFEVLSTAGDTFLGGDDVDLLVAEKMADAFLAQHRVDLRQDQQAFERLRAAAEWAKCQLSAETEVTLRVEELAYGPGGIALDLSFTIRRDELDALIKPLVQRAFDVCEEAMRTAMIRPTQLDNVILVGGSTRIPMVREMVADYFGREALSSIDPDLVVAQGAALQAYALRDEVRPAGPTPLAKVALRKATLVGVKVTPLEEKKLAQPAFAPAPAKIPPPKAAPPPPPGLFDGYEPSEEQPTTIGPRPERPAARDGSSAKRPSDASKSVPYSSISDSADEPTTIGPRPERPKPAAPAASGKPATLPGTQAAPSPPARSPGDGSRPAKLPPLEGAVALGTVAITRTATIGDAPPAPQRPAPPAIPEARLPASRPKAGPSSPPPLVPPEASGLASALEPDDLPMRPPARPPVPQSSPPPRPPPPPAPGWPARAQPASPSLPEPAASPWPTQAQAAPARPTQAQPGSPGPHAASPWPTQPQGAFPTQPQPAVPALPPAASPWPQAQPEPAFGAPAPTRPPSASPPAAWSAPELSLPMPAAAPPLLLDVTPHSLGVETVGRYSEVVIRRNAAIPVEQTRVFATAQDDQETVVVKVVQGEARASAENQTLGTIELSGIRRALRGQVRIAVTFVMGQDGTLNVEAKDLESGRAQSVRLSLVGSMTDADVANMTKRQESMLGRPS